MALQKEFGVSVHVEDASIKLQDDRRTDNWGGYGDWDAWLLNRAEDGSVRVADLQFENFDLWGK